MRVKPLGSLRCILTVPISLPITVILDRLLDKPLIVNFLTFPWKRKIAYKTLPTN
jgi:hypothetical protein